MTNPISELALPILTCLLAFSVTGRLASLWQQQPKDRSLLDFFVDVEFVCGLLVCLSLVFQAPLVVRYGCYFLLIVAFLFSNFYIWRKLLLKRVEPDTQAPTLGDMNNEGQSVSLIGVSHIADEVKEKDIS